MISGSDLPRHHMENSNAQTRFHALCEVQTWQKTPQPLRLNGWIRLMRQLRLSGLAAFFPLDFDHFGEPDSFNSTQLDSLIATSEFCKKLL